MARVGQELLSAPFPEIVRELGVSIAEAQYEMDKVSVRIAQMMAGYVADEDDNFRKDDGTKIKLKAGGEKYSLLQLGFTPTFYQFVDTVIELKMAATMTETREKRISGRARALFVASVSASYSQKYQYSVEGSSLMRTKLVTVPAPAAFESRIQEDLLSEDDS